jgi:cell division protein FtsI (penicillin-binding protein 3)
MRYTWRFYVVAIVFLMLFLALVWRLFDLTLVHRDFLVEEGAKRSMRVQTTAVHRGMITDRFGDPLAISTPVASIWMNPQEMDQVIKSQWQSLAGLLDMPVAKLVHKFNQHKGKQFVYLRRRMTPDQADKIMALAMPGIHLQQEYRRFYPKGEATAHWVGLTNVDDKGVEGMEFAYDDYLAGKPDKFLVMKDRQGNVVKQLRQLEVGHQGQVLALSMDHRIQYLAYHELSKAVANAKAESGSLVVLDVKTGEVLALANAPSYNPNNPSDFNASRSRNRVVTDMFEPGSTLKAFSAMAALESGQYDMNTIVDASGGALAVDKYVIKDHGHDYGQLSLGDVLKKSSNIGIAKVAMSLPPHDLYALMHRMGFGESTFSGLPGEVAGRLVEPEKIKDADVASLSFGYGMASTTLQLAQAYAVLANHGVKLPLSLFPVQTPPKGVRVFDRALVDQLLVALHEVVDADGTGKKARVPGYQVAGKTGTAYIAGANGYDEGAHRYVASFAGMLPWPNPRIVMVVVVRDPKKGHYGGQIAAPVFAKVAARTMRFFGGVPMSVKGGT